VRLGSCDVRVNLWDLAGGEEYFEVRNEFYKEAQGCILVYDVNNRASFQVKEGRLRVTCELCAHPSASPCRGRANVLGSGGVRCEWRVGSTGP
jgi:hypothetical protein